MRRPATTTVHEAALLGLACSGFLAVAASRQLDVWTVALCGAAYALRLLWVLRGARPRVAWWMAALAAAGALWAAAQLQVSTGGLALDALLLATAAQLWTAHTGRAHAITGALALLELVAGALLVADAAYLGCLALFLLCAMAALASGEVRRGLQRPVRVSRPGPIGARLTAFALALGVAVLALTAGLFLVLPRTARLLADRLPVLPGRHLTRLASQVGLGGIGRLKSDERAVLHVKAYSRQIPLGMKWRGGTLSDFDGRVWSEAPPDRGIVRAERGTVAVADGWQRRRAGARALYRVEFSDLEGDALFVAGTPEFLNVGAGRLLETAAATFRVVPAGAGPVRYEVSSFLRPAGSAFEERPRPALSAEERERCLRLPALDARIARLAAADAGGAERDFERAQAIAEHLRRDYGYTLQAPAAAPRDALANFLFERRAGHCEYFASAMAVMLRTQGIPARVVTGFESGIFNPYSGLLTLRASDAHSWVEAFLAERGWTTFDPTPPAADRSPAWLADLRLRLDAADSFWREWVLDYDLARQMQLVERLNHGPRGWAWWGAVTRGAARPTLRETAAAAALALALLAALWKWGGRAGAGREGARRVPDAVRAYERMLRIVARRGMHRAPAQTPREFAAACRDARLAPLLQQFTEDYLRLRFSGEPEPHFAALTEQLRALRAAARGTR